ncbi:MAG: hypothetical protein ACLQA5_08425 [Solirubrobacteraceae bacterium]
MTDDVQATAHPATAQPASRQAATEPVTQPQAAKPGGDPARNESVVTRLMRAGSDEVDALLEALGMREQLSGEAQDIARLVERRLAEVAWGDHSHALDQLEIQRAFLVHRFIGPLKSYERSFRGYSILDNFLNLTSILAGVGASLAAALNAPKVYAIVLGLIVGLLQSISQWLKPSQRSTRRGLAAADLRDEAWAFLQRRDRYRGKDDLTAWTLLCDQVNRVEDREQSEQDKESAQVPSTTKAKGR